MMLFLSSCYKWLSDRAAGAKISDIEIRCVKSFITSYCKHLERKGHMLLFIFASHVVVQIE